jgi:hypothetical protein
MSARGRSWLLAALLPFTVLVAFWVPAHAAPGDEYADKRKKVALVIGLSAYRNAVKLNNTLNDADLVSKRLAATGFEVHPLRDAMLPEIKAEIGKFLEAAKDADIAVVYYAGHAIQIDGQNYILPVEFDSNGEDIIGQLYPIGVLVRELGGKSKARVILLDACRDNPFLARIRSTLSQRSVGEGLAPIELPIFDGRKLSDATYGLVIFFATQPQLTALDGKGANSPFATALDQALSDPEEDLNAVMTRTTRLVLTETKGRQQPDFRASLTGPLYLVSRPAPLQCDVLAAEEDNNVSVKGTKWDEIVVSDAEKACRADLERFPTNPRLMHNLARVLDKAGRDVESVALFRKSAELGYDWSQNYLGVQLIEGMGTEQNVSEGVGWLRKASEQGNRQARVNYMESDLTALLEGAPKPTRALQQALLDAGIADVPLSGELDKETLAALEAYKKREGLPGTGVTFQVLDKLAILDTVFNSRREK